MKDNNIVIVDFTKEPNPYITGDLFAFDYGQQLRLIAPDMPDYAEVHFSWHRTDKGAITQVGVKDGDDLLVTIPEFIIAKESNHDYFFHVWLYPDTAPHSAESAYHARLRVIARAKPVYYAGMPFNPFSDVLRKIRNWIDNVVTPKAKVEDTEEGHLLTVKDADGVTTALIIDGKDGDPKIDDTLSVTGYAADAYKTGYEIREIIKNIKLAGYYVTPEMFGAYGDGITDDSEAINNALQDGRPVICKGTYLFTEINIDRDDASLLGGTFKFKPGTANNSSQNYYPVNISADRVLLKDCAFYGNKESNTSYRVCDVITCMGDNCYFDHVSIYEAPDSAFMISESVNTILNCCVVDDARDCGFYMNNNNLDSDNFNLLLGCNIRNCGASGIGIKRQSKNLVIENCILEDCLNGITAETIAEQGGLHSGTVSNCIIKNLNGNIGIGFSNSEFVLIGNIIIGYKTAIRVIQNSRANITGGEIQIKANEDTGTKTGVYIQNSICFINGTKLAGEVSGSRGIHLLAGTGYLYASNIDAEKFTLGHAFRLFDADDMHAVLNGCYGSIYTKKQTILNHLGGNISQAGPFLAAKIGSRQIWLTDTNSPPEDRGFMNNGDILICTVTGSVQNLVACYFKNGSYLYKVPMELVTS